MKRPRVITVFGSSLPRAGDAHYGEAHELGSELARQGFVVCTGGYAGVMEAVCRGAKEAGGRTMGVTAAFFASRANKWVDEEIRVRRWHDRLFELVERGHGYVVCRGGTGTLVELAVVAIGDFWAPVVERVNEVEDNKHRKQKEPRLVRFAASPQDAAKYLANHFARSAAATT